MADQVLTVDFSRNAAPQGTHFAQNTPDPTCLVGANSVTCPINSFDLVGVGNTNAVAALSADFSATVDCFNPGRRNQNNPVESHTQTVTATATSGAISPKNGRLTVDPITATGPTAEQFQAMATCPNPNWTPVLREGTINLSGFVYTVTFVGSNKPAIKITGP